jgi:hypothetical protein
MNMKIYDSKYYHSKQNRIPGSNYRDVLSAARQIYSLYTKRTKRNPYIRSKYFDKEKVFLNVFWTHIMQKRINERTRRLKLYAVALDLIENTLLKPSTKAAPNNSNVQFHRFYGKSGDGIVFYVQIKEELKSGNKYLMSIVVPKESKT